MGLRIDDVEWDSYNEVHATERATADEIDQVLLDGKSRARRNKIAGTGTHQVQGRTDAGRGLLVVIIYKPPTRTARPITAWDVKK